MDLDGSPGGKSLNGQAGSSPIQLAPEKHTLLAPAWMVLFTGLDASNLGLHNLIPSLDEIKDDKPTSNEAGRADGPIPLKKLFNFTTTGWVNLHNDYATKYLDNKLELCELLNQDMETKGDTEVDVDKTTGDILMG